MGWIKVSCPLLLIVAGCRYSRCGGIARRWLPFVNARACRMPCLLVGRCPGGVRDGTRKKEKKEKKGGSYRIGKEEK